MLARSVRGRLERLLARLSAGGRILLGPLKSFQNNRRDLFSLRWLYVRIRLTDRLLLAAGDNERAVSWLDSISFGETIFNACQPS